MRRRPWWLIADTPGRARVQLVFPAFFLFLLLFRRPRPSWEWWEVVGLGVFVVLVGTSVATLVTFRRHPDWVGRAWAASRTSIWWQRHGREVLVGVLVVGVLAAVVGIVLAVTGAGGTGVVLLVGGLLVATAGGMSLATVDAFGPGGSRDADAPSDDQPSRST